MSSKVKTIEPCRFLQHKELNELHGGCQLLFGSCPLNYESESCGTAEMYTRCDRNFEAQCLTKTITCGGSGVAVFQFCPGGMGESFDSCEVVYQVG